MALKYRRQWKFRTVLVRLLPSLGTERLLIGEVLEEKCHLGKQMWILRGDGRHTEGGPEQGMITVSSWGEEQIGHAKWEDDLQGRFYARKTNQIQNMESTELQTVYRIKVFFKQWRILWLKKKEKGNKLRNGYSRHWSLFYHILAA